MKRGSLQYLTKEGLRNVWVNRLMSAASVAVLLSCLVIIGCASMLFANINAILDKVEDQNVVMVYLADGADQAAIDEAGAAIEALSNIEASTFVPKEDALPAALEDFGANPALFEGMDNPLPDAYKVTIRDLEQFDATVAELRAVSHVDSVRENSDIASQLTSIRRAVTMVSVGIIAMLLLVSLFIIANTVRVTMYSRRLEISIMKAVGATPWFIRWPFMIEGMVLGILSGVLSFFLVWGIYAAVVKAFSATMAILMGGAMVPFTNYWWQMLLSFLGIGVFTGVLGSAVSMNKYLKEEGSDAAAN